MSESHRLFNAWLLAERHSSTATRGLFDADLAFTRGRGPLPPAGLMEEAIFRRALAHDLLSSYLAEVERESALIRADTRRASALVRGAVD